MSEGLAILFSGDPETGESTMDVFRESENPDTDPYHRAQGLRRSCERDFPDRMWSIAVNERARDLMSDTRMRAMGFTDEDLESLR